MCKTLSDIRYAMYGLCTILFSVRISYWSRDWYGKHSGSRKQGPTIREAARMICMYACAVPLCMHGVQEPRGARACRWIGCFVRGGLRTARQWAHKLSAFESCRTLFPRSTVLTASVPGSVADTQREQKWYRNRASHILHRTESYT